MGGSTSVTCTEGVQLVGDSSLINSPTPLVGNIGCVDPDAVAYRATLDVSIAGGADGSDGDLSTVSIYGPMEAGFDANVPLLGCLGDVVITGGVDTLTAELMVENTNDCGELALLGTCGDHANPSHFHEYLTNCLTYTTSDGATAGMSSRLGTAGDGRGIYGKYGPGGSTPTLDACGAAYGPTPDSGGASVVHYHAQPGRPFFLGCYSNEDATVTLDECRAMYTECGDDSNIVSITTGFGTGDYHTWCPCFDTATQSNVKLGDGSYAYPAFYDPAAAPSSTTATTAAASSSTTAAGTDPSCTYPSADYPDCASIDTATGWDPDECASLSCGGCAFVESGDGPDGGGTCMASSSAPGSGSATTTAAAAPSAPAGPTKLIIEAGASIAIEAGGKIKLDA